MTMALPKLMIPTYKTQLPSSKKEIEYRPFTVKEEKILLMALEEGTRESFMTGIKKLLNACILTEDIKIEEGYTLDNPPGQYGMRFSGVLVEIVNDKVNGFSLPNHQLPIH